MEETGSSFTKILLLFMCFGAYLAFNIDTKVPIVKDGVSNSYFGFSVAQHQIYQEPTKKTKHVFLVGAPRDNVTDPNVPQSVRNLKSPGVVYSCPFSSFRDDCQWLSLDTEASGDTSVKDDMWLGGSVASQGTAEGSAVACAHRYVQGNNNYRHGLGFCITITNTLDENTFLEPCSGLPSAGVHTDYGMCQAGTSVDVDQGGDVLVGAPGARSWRGAAYKTLVNPGLFDDAGWFQSAADDVTDEKPEPLPAVKYYSYLGMSSKVANIIEGKKTYISGAPRAEDAGQVLMFTQGDDNLLEIKPEHYLTGEKFGSWFGCAIAVADLNNDGKEDLIVGAPFFSGKYIGGAIYVYMNGPEGITSSTEPVKITSRSMTQSECEELDCENGRFGLSIASLGDVDWDGFDDIAVGAPYEGDGAVYIFRGSQNGIITTPSQRITAANLTTARPLKTFGYALGGGNDMDENGYPDLVVGAYDSDKALVLRSRPVVTVKSILRSLDDKIDSSQTRCAKDNRPFNCFEISVCFNFEAKPKEQFQDQLPIHYKLEAERFTGRLISRVFFKDVNNDQSHVIEVDKLLKEQDSANPLTCVTHLVYMINFTGGIHSTHFITSVDLYFRPVIVQLRESVTVKFLLSGAFEVLDMFTERLDLNYVIQGETFTGKRVSRIFFKGAEEGSPDRIERSLRMNDQFNPAYKCKEHMVYVIKNNKDFLHPIQFRLTYNLKDVDTPTMNPGEEIPPFNTYPIMDQSQAEKFLAVPFENNCGSDDVCYSDLHVSGSFPALNVEDGSYILKVKGLSFLRLLVDVYNDGEDAHETTLYINLPSYLSYKGTSTYKEGEPEEHSCSLVETVVVCSLGNPLKSKHEVKFYVRLEPREAQANVKDLEVTMLANTTSTEVDKDNDSALLKIKLVVESDLAVYGGSFPVDVFYGGLVRGESAIQYEEEIGFQVVHTYDVRNDGDGLVPSSKVVIHWPYETQSSYEHGKHLLYLMEEPLVDKPGVCKTEPYMVNPRKYKEDPALSLRNQMTRTPNIEEVLSNSTEDNKLRKKRETVIRAENVRDGTTGKMLKVVKLDCMGDRPTAKCFEIVCEIGELMPKSSVAIKLRARVWNATFFEDYKNVDAVYVYSHAVLSIGSELNIKETTEDNNVATALTKSIPDIKVQDRPGVPIWAYIVAALAGLLLLIILIVVLFKCGFFQRRRHPDDLKTHKGKVEKQNYDDPYYN